MSTRQRTGITASDGCWAQPGARHREAGQSHGRQDHCLEGETGFVVGDVEERRFHLDACLRSSGVHRFSLSVWQPLDRIRTTGYGPSDGRRNRRTMERLLLTYHPETAFLAGRLTDRLSLRLGGNVISLLHPNEHPNLDDLAGMLADHIGLVVVAPGSASGSEPLIDASVHLAVSLAIRQNLPIVHVQLQAGRSHDIEHDWSTANASGLVHVEIDPDQLDAESDRLIAGLENWLTGTRTIPRIELGPTMVPAFVGITDKLPADSPNPRQPRPIATWSQFEQLYGSFTKDALLPMAIFGWFANGGRECYVAPIQSVLHDDAPGHSSASITPSDYAGSEVEQVGIFGLSRLDDVTAVILPDVATVACNEDGTVDLARWKSIQLAAINNCESYNRMALLDPPPGMNPQEVKEWRTDDAMYDSQFACLHYPWLLTLDPLGWSNERMAIPPSGHVAGTWARSDRERGVWQSPANQVLGSVLDTELQPSPGERFLLTPIGINAIRAFRDSADSIRTWGSRTLSTDPHFQSLEISRLSSAILRACGRGLRWAAFEPDRDTTRSTAKRQIEEFLTELWKAGALVGQHQSEAFFVECSDDSDGIGFNVTVGIALLSPGIFIQLAFGRRFGEPGAIIG